MMKQVGPASTVAAVLAQTALALTLKRYPEVKQDPQFLAVLQLVCDKLGQQKQ